MKTLDLTDQTFGRLTVIRFGPYHPENGRIRWLCKCTCGNEVLVMAKELRNGHTKSCGCLKTETTSIRSTTHGQTGTPTYMAWKDMIKRCYNPKDKRFEIYGGRGIYVCDRWLHSYENFFADMGECPDDKTIGRTNNDGPYEPSNCRWETRKEQANNKRTNHLITFRGQQMTMMQFAEKIGIPYNVVKQRINKLGWSPEECLTSVRPMAK